MRFSILISFFSSIWAEKLDCEAARINAVTLNRPKTLQNVYCEIFSGVWLKDGETVNEKGKSVNFTDDGFDFNSILHKGQSDEFIKQAQRMQRTGDPYTLREATYPYSVNKFWRECQWEDEENRIEEDNFYHCLNRFDSNRSSLV
jgi:hypothetical protein